MGNLQIAVIVGSLRKESLNRHLANAIIKMLPSNVNLKVLEIGDLPLYNQDDDEHQADSEATELKRAMNPGQVLAALYERIDTDLSGQATSINQVVDVDGHKIVWVI